MKLITKLYDQISNIYQSFATESEREGISRNLRDTEEWLYEDGDDESENVYAERLEDLKKVTNLYIFFFWSHVNQFPN